MALLLYCFSKKSNTEILVSGLDNQLLKFHTLDGISCAYEEYSEKELKMRLESDDQSDLQEHPAIIFQRVNQSIHKIDSTIPLRLPTVVKNLEALETLIQKNASVIHQELNRVGELAEHTFHFIPKGDIVSEKEPEVLSKAQSPGIQYLKIKYQRHHKEIGLESKLDQVKKLLQSAFKEHIVEMNSNIKLDSININLLAAKQWLITKDDIENLRVSIPNFEIYVFGTLPPFHFVKLKLMSE